MVRAFTAALVALSLAACGSAGSAIQSVPVVANVVVHGPVVYADKTQADETAGRSVEVVYKAARLFVETLVDTGVIHGERAAQFQVLNRRAYAAVQAVRAAYRAGNATSISKALAEANVALAQLVAVAGN